jgi:hypothetical protein
MAVKNGFNLKIIHKSIWQQKSKQNKITGISKIEICKPNKWMKLTYTHSESSKIFARLGLI